MKKYFPVIVMFFFLIAQIISAQTNIVINEIMYNSSGDDVEFIELYNASGTSQNLQNWYILDDNDQHEKCFIEWTMSPGEYLIVVADINSFKLKYQGVLNINPNDFDNGGNGWALGNGSDVIRLFDNSGILQDIVAYSDGGEWPGSPDGAGPSLELLNPSSDNSLATSWDPSSVDDGTPGKINSVYTENTKPICKNGGRSVELPANSDAVNVTVTAFDTEGLSKVELFVNTGGGYISQVMSDDGLNGDAAAGDSIYTAIIPRQSSGTLVKYYALATDNIGQQDSWPNNSPDEYHAYTVDYVIPKLRITELLAVNNSINTDEAGEYDDWFEIHNAGSVNINLKGMYVSNSLGSSKSFELPDVNIAAGEYIVFWADNDTDQGKMHTDFKLGSDGEAIALFETVDHGNVLIHGWKYGIMSGDVSMGLKPEDGNVPEYLNPPTPGASNESSKLFSPVCINEFQTTSNFGGIDDWVEIYNRGTESFDLSGCFLSDQRGNNTKWAFPQGTVLAPGKFLVVYEDALGFSFSSDGDDVIMFSASDSTTGLDFYDFDQQQADKSEGRYPDGVNLWSTLKESTPGSQNSQLTSIEKTQNIIPAEFILGQNYPNPFNPSTQIVVSIPETGAYSLKIYNVLGEEVFILLNGQINAGTHTFNFDASNLTSGIYFYNFSGNNFNQTKKMMLLK